MKKLMLVLIAVLGMTAFANAQSNEQRQVVGKYQESGHYKRTHANNSDGWVTTKETKCTTQKTSAGLDAFGSGARVTSTTRECDNGTRTITTETCGTLGVKGGALGIGGGVSTEACKTTIIEQKKSTN